MKYEIVYKGFANTSYGETSDRDTVEAESLDEAWEKGIKWCAENTTCWGYDWYVDYIIDPEGHISHSRPVKIQENK